MALIVGLLTAAIALMGYWNTQHLQRRDRRGVMCACAWVSFMVDPVDISKTITPWLPQVYLCTLERAYSRMGSRRAAVLIGVVVACVNGARHAATPISCHPGSVTIRRTIWLARDKPATSRQFVR